MRRGFTLIELLIVVAIIAILAAIAVPNFLEAQMRSKVSRCQADLRTIATGLESYCVDYQKYPMDHGWYQNAIWGGTGCSGTAAEWPGGVAPDMVLFRLTTPVSYLATVPSDVFPNRTFTTNWVGTQREFNYAYWAKAVICVQEALQGMPPSQHQWALFSAGPDKLPSAGGFYIWGAEYLESRPGSNTAFGISTPGCLYDPTNGTISDGDIVRVGP